MFSIRKPRNERYHERLLEINVNEINVAFYPSYPKIRITGVSSLSYNWILAPS